MTLKVSQVHVTRQSEPPSQTVSAKSKDEVNVNKRQSKSTTDSMQSQILENES